VLRDNVKRNEIGQVEAILCWMCGTTVAGWTDDNIAEVRSVNNQQQMVVRQKFRVLANYRKVQTTLDTGELYSPIVCAKCAPRCGCADIKAIMANDMDVQAKQGLKREVAAEFAKKRVVSVDRVVKSQGAE